VHFKILETRFETAGLKCLKLKYDARLSCLNFDFQLAPLLGGPKDFQGVILRQ
jgi:hypothetical protein